MSYDAQNDPLPFTVVNNNVLYDPDSLYNTFLSNANKILMSFGDYEKYTSFFDAVTLIE